MFLSFVLDYCFRWLSWLFLIRSYPVLPFSPPIAFSDCPRSLKILLETVSPDLKVGCPRLSSDPGRRNVPPRTFTPSQQWPWEEVCFLYIASLWMRCLNTPQVFHSRGVNSSEGSRWRILCLLLVASNPCWCLAPSCYHFNFAFIELWPSFLCFQIPLCFKNSRHWV